uniref:Uncharacterized protein n=1 Tax=viral metagenome TaxID=1070528 RepID=A0A6C0JPJ8_9ZZZZ
MPKWDDDEDETVIISEISGEIETVFEEKDDSDSEYSVRTPNFKRNKQVARFNEKDDKSVWEENERNKNRVLINICSKYGEKEFDKKYEMKLLHLNNELFNNVVDKMINNKLLDGINTFEQIRYFRLIEKCFGKLKEKKII